MIPGRWRPAFEHWAGTEQGVKTILTILAALALGALLVGLSAS